VLPSIFLKLIGVSLLVFGAYDTKVYWYALTTGEGTFDFFGRELPARHRGVKIGFTSVLVFYYAVGTVLLIFG
jgi:hypothetical protein